MRLVSFCIMTFFYCLCFSNALAVEHNKKNVLNKRIMIYGGLRLYQADGTFTSTRTGSPPVRVDMDDLGLEKNEVNGIGGLIFNFKKRWNIRFDYFGYHDDATKTAEKSFNFDGVNIPVNATLDSSLNMDLYVLSLAYNIMHTQRARFGLGVGVHGIDFDLKISGKLTVGGVETPLGEGQEDFIAPVPNLWVYGAYGFTQRFILRYGAGWMSAGYGDYDGSLFLANAAIEYWPFQNAGFGIGYNYIKADINYDSGHKKDNYDIDLPGVVFYITLGF